MGFLRDKKKRAELLRNPPPFARLFALLCKAGCQREACKIVLDEAKQRALAPGGEK